MAVTTASKKRKLLQSEPDGAGRGSTTAARRPPKLQKSFVKSAAEWDLTANYDQQRHRTAKKKRKTEKESNRLPFKTADGLVAQPYVAPDEDDDATGVSGGDDDEDWLEKLGDAPDHVLDDAEDERQRDAEPQKSEQEQILEAQEEMAKIATALNEEPEEHGGSFKALARIGESRFESVQKLAMVTQMTVYRDVIPGYRIRPADEQAKGEKVSKDIHKLRQYEQALVAGYQTFIRKLAQCARRPSSQPAGQRKHEKGQSLPSVAIACACTLLQSVSHFNFRSDLIKIIVGPLSRRSMDADFLKCRTTLENLFREDEDGRASFEAVSTVVKMVRAREFKVDETVLNLFLHLRLLSEFSGKASQDQVDKSNDDVDGGAQKGLKKKHREFRTKREKKALKEQKVLDKDMAEADAVVSHEEKDRMQSETLKLVFTTYFRILKARTPHLMGAVLEGLAMYAHLINQDFFGDLLEALKELIRDTAVVEDNEDGDSGEEDAGDEDETSSTDRNACRESLLCTITAYALLAGQDAHNSRSNLHLDLSFFDSELYKSLMPLSLEPDLERTSRSLSKRAVTNGTTTSENKVNLQTTTVLLVRSLTSVLLPPWNIRSVPPLRLASFTKQLMTAALHMPDKSGRALLALVADVADTHGAKVSGLWHTDRRVVNGAFNPLAAAGFEASNPFAATVWEGEILRCHFSPGVREGVRMIEKMVSRR